MSEEPTKLAKSGSLHRRAREGAAQGPQGDTDTIKQFTTLMDKVRDLRRNPLGLFGSVPAAGWIGEVLSQLPGVEVKWWMTAGITLLLHAALIMADVLGAVLKRVDSVTGEVKAAVRDIGIIAEELKAGKTSQDSLSARMTNVEAEVAGWKEAAERRELLEQADALGVPVKGNTTIEDLRRLVKRAVSQGALRALGHKAASEDTAVEPPDIGLPPLEPDPN